MAFQTAALEEVCLAVPLVSILEHVRMLVEMEQVLELVPNIQSLFFLLALSLAQCRLGIMGAIGEIGTTFTDSILTFRSLSLVRRGSDSLFLSGPFLGDDFAGFDLPMAAFDERPEVCYLGDRPQRFHRHSGHPGKLQSADLLRAVGTGFRALRLDRTRGANETLALLRASKGSLVEGGLLIFEGLQGMSQRPGLQEGFHRFMLEEESAPDNVGQRLVPFLWTGKHGGLFLTHERHAHVYRKAVLAELPANKFINTHHDTKFMYGSQVLCAIWEADVLRFEALLGRARAGGLIK